jgi:hypothetical protein
VAQPGAVFGYILDLLRYRGSFGLDFGALLLGDGGAAGVYLDFGELDKVVEPWGRGLGTTYGILGIKMEGRLAVLRQQVAACLLLAVLAYVTAGVRAMFWLDNSWASKMKRRNAPPYTYLL